MVYDEANNMEWDKKHTKINVVKFYGPVKYTKFIAFKVTCAQLITDFMSFMHFQIQ